MPNSINGWPVLDNPPWSDPRLTKMPVPGVPKRTLTLRTEVLPLFLALAKDYHDTIAPIDEGELDDWSYSYREARAANAWSDHASGTAIDLNAGKEGWLGMGNYSWWKNPAKHKAAQDIKKRYEVVMWGGSKDFGGDYYNGSTVDWMHWAIKPGVSLAQVQAVIKKLGIDANGNRAGSNDRLDRAIQRRAMLRDEVARRKQAGESLAGLRTRLHRVNERIKRLRG
jgi:hypothetical protein